MHVLFSTVVENQKIKNIHRCIGDVSFGEKGENESIKIGNKN